MDTQENKPNPLVLIAAAGLVLWWTGFFGGKAGPDTPQPQPPGPVQPDTSNRLAKPVADAVGFLSHVDRVKFAALYDTAADYIEDEAAPALTAKRSVVAAVRDKMGMASAPDLGKLLATELSEFDKADADRTAYAARLRLIADAIRRSVDWEAYRGNN